MKSINKEILNTLGIKSTCDIPIRELLNPDWETLKNYGLTRTPTNMKRLEAAACLLRTSDDRDISGTIIRDAETVAMLFRDRLRQNDTEKVWTLTLDVKNRIIKERLLNEGTNNSCFIDIKTIIRNALFDGAAGVIVLHNHPSGDTRPSAADLKQTEKLRDALNAFDLALLDHIILAKESFFSFEAEERRRYSDRTNIGTSVIQTN